MKSDYRLLAVSATAIIGTQASDGVNWGSEDFVFAGLLVIGAGLIYAVLIRPIKNVTKRIVAIGLLLLVFALIWVEAAVGIFD